MVRPVRSRARRSPCRFASRWRARCAALAALLVVLLAGALASAAPRDKAALKKIDEALTVHYLNMDFDAAEGVLLGTIRACEDKCSAQIIGKAWMYVGIIKGAGRNDLAAAQDAFSKAVAADPNVQLDEQVATDPVKALFSKVKGGGAKTGGGTPPPAPSGGGFNCTPTQDEIETRRPIPVACEADTDLKGAKLHFKAFGGEWTTIKMEPNAGAYRATIPCAATQNTGKLRFYVEGIDATGDVAVRYGSKDSPKIFEIVSETTADPPAFPDEEPPARCSIEGMEKPSGEGGGGGGSCGSWGNPCGADNCCDSGLTCANGTCEKAECESDSDCKNGGTCEKGACSGGEGAAGPYKKNWIGLEYALDLASISSDSACSADSRNNDNFACFDGSGNTYTGVPNVNGAGTISGGFTPSTMRILASFEHLFGSIGLQGRVGFAFNSGYQPAGGTPFLPVHVEARAKWWVLGASAFSKKGLRPWLHVGGGLAQVNAVVNNVDVADCGRVPPPGSDPTTIQNFQKCVTNPQPKLAPGNAAPVNDQARKRTLTAQKQLGESFVTVGAGVMFAIGPNHGPVLNLNFMIPFPSVGFVLEPSLGYVFGF